jgi:acetyltransferase-like isoleucine patch superfamily enzyme
MNRAIVGADDQIDDDTIIGYQHREDAAPARIGENATIRSGAIIYADVDIGDDLVTGHDVLIREETTAGNDVLVGTRAVIDGRATIGSHSRLQTGVYVPPETSIGERVFLGPYAALTNDPAPLREECGLDGPTLEADVSIGANATIMPGVTVGSGAFVAAGAVVTEDVPPESLAIGVPARARPLPERLQGRNEVS